jgi:hypothetical protein
MDPALTLSSIGWDARSRGDDGHVRSTARRHGSAVADRASWDIGRQGEEGPRSNARYSLVGIRRQSAQSDKGLAKLLQKAAPAYPLAGVTS